MVKQSGISFTIDHRDERTFFYAANPVFRCWHLQNIYFALPSPSKSREDNPSQPEVSLVISRLAPTRSASGGTLCD